MVFHFLIPFHPGLSRFIPLYLAFLVLYISPSLNIEAGTAAPYVTRAVVYRPLAAANFNGTVIVEWMNVTSGSDVSPVLIYTHNELIREGYVLVSLSAQAAGVESTKALDPERYTRLQHPGTTIPTTFSRKSGRQSGIMPICFSTGSFHSVLSVPANRNLPIGW